MDLETIVWELVSKLAGGEYEGVIAYCFASRLSADDLRSAIDDYGKTFIVPPKNAYQNLDVVTVRDSRIPTWSVRAPLWSQEEGRSDLELQLTIQQQGDHFAVGIDDLIVP